MTITISPTEFDANVALRTFLLSVLPANTPVIRGQVNRAPEPKDSNFVVMTPIRRTLLAMNFDQFVDTKMTASIAGSIMTVTGIDYGSLKDGSVLFGTGVAQGTQVISQISGSVGGTGTYSVSTSETVGSQIIAAGVLNALQSTELTVQLDVHGPIGADNAQRISTMLMDDYAFLSFARQGTVIRPLYADNRGQIPFINAEQQYEDRWIVDACLQVNATVQDIPQQFFDQIYVERVPADIIYVP